MGNNKNYKKPGGNKPSHNNNKKKGLISTSNSYILQKYILHS